MLDSVGSRRGRGRRRLASAAVLACVPVAAGAVSIAGTQASPPSAPRVEAQSAVRMEPATGRGSGRDRPVRVRPGLLPTPRPGAPTTGDDEEHSLLATASPQASAPQPLTFSTAGAPPVLGSFPGLTTADGRADPPDPEIAAGNGSVVEMVNNAIRVFGTDGSVRATYDTARFFNSTSGDVTDPRIVYDDSTGRWFASIDDSGEGSVRLAVSQTSDPTGPWTIYDHAPGACPDQPTLGVSQTLVVIGYGGFTLPCRSQAANFLGGGHYVYDKAELLTGGTAHFTYWDPNPPYFPIAAVSSGPDPADAVTLTAGFEVELFIFSGVPTATTQASETVTTIIIRSLSTAPAAAQKGGANPVRTGDIRIRSAAEDPASGTIWLEANDGCTPPGDSTTRSCLRIVALRAGKVIYDGDIAWKGGNVYYGRIAVDGNGNAVVVHGFSSDTTDPSVGVFAVGANGGVTPSATLASGNEAHDDFRFGDYFGAAPDGSGGVWVVGETGSFVTGSPFDWGTTIAHVGASATPPPPPPPPPRDTKRPSARALSSPGRHGRTARLRYRAFDDSGKTREQIVVYSRSTILKRISVRLSTTRAGKTYTAAWLVPASPVPPLKFCVTAFDPAGNASARSCARITVS